MFKALDKPIKLHIADAYTQLGEPVVYDADSIDTTTDMFNTLYLIYGTVDNPANVDVLYLQTLGCINPKVYNPDTVSNLTIGGIWLE